MGEVKSRNVKYLKSNACTELIWI